MARRARHNVVKAIVAKVHTSAAATIRFFDPDVDPNSDPATRPMVIGSDGSIRSSSSSGPGRSASE